MNGFNDYASKANDDWYADYGENWYRDMLGVLDDWESIRKDAASIGYDSRGAYDDLKSLADSIGKQREYYASLFETQEEYDQYRKQEEMLGVDLNAVSQEIAGLKQQRSDYIRANVNDRRVTSKRDAYLQGIKDWDAKIAERENYFNEAKELQDSIQAEKDREVVLGADLNALQREVESLTARRERYAQDHDYDWTDQGQRAAHEAYLQEQDSLIAQKKQYLNRARYLQEQAKLSGVADRNSEYYDPEFRRYSQYQSTQKENPAWWESGVGDPECLTAMDMMMHVDVLGWLPADLRSTLDDCGVVKMGITELFALLFILYEATSVLKNMLLCGLPVPAGMREKLASWLDSMTDEIGHGQGAAGGNSVIAIGDMVDTDGAQSDVFTDIRVEGFLKTDQNE